jgi:hypothetical protein
LQNFKLFVSHIFKNRRRDLSRVGGLKARLIEVLILCKYEISDELALHKFDAPTIGFHDVHLDHIKQHILQTFKLIRRKQLILKSNHIFKNMDRKQNQAEVCALKAQLPLLHCAEEIGQDLHLVG